ncbi:MAG: DNA gyrase C-terminal beta-propeller domain-containing protein, partial [Aurantimonas coralicida]|nr:DNA gyrase C-terminal beta-propeller domain-containing protein [Aurantimonas coralicida]
QAEAILNMRLRSLRKLEEFELKREFDTLTAEKAEKEALLASDERQWAGIAAEVREVRETYSKKTKIGRRRTLFADAPNRALDDITVALIEKEPITVVLSKKGFLRGMKGHLADFSSLAFREGDGLQLAFHAMTTDKLLFLSTGGRAFTHGADKLPGGRGQGEPIRLAFELEDDQDIALAFVADPERRRLLVSSDGNGFVASEADMLANTRKGKQLMNVAGKTRLALAAPVGAGDHVAIVGENRKLLVFPLVQVPQMTRGKGVRLQRYKDGGLSDARVFAMADGLTWTDSAGRSFTRSETELLEWRGDRAQAGRLVPKGFPKTNRFDG